MAILTGTRVGLPVIAFASASDWEQWLSRQPHSSNGLWLKLAKKGSGIESVSQQEAIDGALCYGWIDGQLQKFDERYWLVRFTPRSAKSRWSSINQTRVQTLIDTGCVTRFSTAFTTPRSLRRGPTRLQNILRCWPEARPFIP